MAVSEFSLDALYRRLANGWSKWLLSLSINNTFCCENKAIFVPLLARARLPWSTANVAPLGLADAPVQMLILALYMDSWVSYVM